MFLGTPLVGKRCAGAALISTHELPLQPPSPLAPSPHARSPDLRPLKWCVRTPEKKPTRQNLQKGHRKTFDFKIFVPPRTALAVQAFFFCSSAEEEEEEEEEDLLVFNDTIEEGGK